MSKRPVSERFWEKVQKSEGCWIWTASTQPKGYGQFMLAGRPMLAHRVAWWLHYGRWPEPCALHECDNPLCVRPDHLFEGTVADNNRDMYAKGRAWAQNRPRKTHCLRGHEMTPENTKLHRGSRSCKECARDVVRRRRADSSALAAERARARELYHANLEESRRKGRESARRRYRRRETNA